LELTSRDRRHRRQLHFHRLQLCLRLLYPQLMTHDFLGLFQFTLHGP
jgi:hypothetical protein